MKCWICGKEETNVDVKINVERLIGAVQEHFEHEQDYKMACKKPYWKWTPEEKETYIRRDRDLQGSMRAINDLCVIIGIDCNKLYTIARLARKWEQKRKWQYCFPVRDCEKKIVEYLTDPDKSFDSNINYIHYKINKKVVPATQNRLEKSHAKAC
jgi:hypothetical protein